MTVLLWILAVLAVPTLLFGLWMAGVFLKEFFSPSADVDPDVAEAMGLLPHGAAEHQARVRSRPVWSRRSPPCAAATGRRPPS